MCQRAIRLGITKLKIMTSMPSSSQPTKVATRVDDSRGVSERSQLPGVASEAVIAVNRVYAVGGGHPVFLPFACSLRAEPRRHLPYRSPVAINAIPPRELLQSTNTLT